MWAGVFFFFAFTCVIYLMHDAVDLSQSHSPLTALVTSPKSFVDKIIIDKTALIILNLMFAAVTLGASISCLLYGSLDHFFHDSTMYAVYTFSDVFKNLLVSSVFLFYGCRLRSRINAFAEMSVVNNVDINSPLDEVRLLRKLKKVVRRLLSVMIVCEVCFALRTLMLILKCVVVEESNVNIFWLPTYGKRHEIWCGQNNSI